MSDETAPSVSRRLKAIMVERGITQSQLAEAMGLSQASISRRMIGAKPWTIDELERAAVVLGVHLTLSIDDRPVASVA